MKSDFPREPGEVPGCRSSPLDIPGENNNVGKGEGLFGEIGINIYFGIRTFQLCTKLYNM